MLEKLAGVEQRYEAHAAAMASPAVQSDANEYRRHAKALAEIEPLVEAYREYRQVVGQMTQARSGMAPDWPTFKEQGYNFEMASLRGIAAPKGLPAAIRERLVNAIERAAADPALRVQAERVYAPLRFLGPAAYEAELRSAEALFRQIWKEAPWTDR